MSEFILIRPITDAQREGVEEGPLGVEKALTCLTAKLMAELTEKFFLLHEAACDAAPSGVKFDFELSATVTVGLQWVVTAAGEGGVTLTAEGMGRKKSPVGTAGTPAAAESPA